MVHTGLMSLCVGSSFLLVNVAVKDSRLLQLWLLKISVFWDIIPCSLLKMNPLFGGTYRLHLKGRRICLTRKHETIGKQILRMEVTCSSET
jgi:hypothetical protein